MGHIHEDYLTAVQALIQRHRPSRILKCDCWNEADGDTPIANVVGAECVEIAPDCIRRAQARFPGLVATVGDIREMPFADKTFDMVIDLSTIDHMFDFQVALDEYVRVTKGASSISSCGRVPIRRTTTGWTAVTSIRRGSTGNTTSWRRSSRARWRGRFGA